MQHLSTGNSETYIAVESCCKPTVASSLIQSLCRQEIHMPFTAAKAVSVPASESRSHFCSSEGNVGLLIGSGICRSSLSPPPRRSRRTGACASREAIRLTWTLSPPTGCMFNAAQSNDQDSPSSPDHSVACPLSSCKSSAKTAHRRIPRLTSFKTAKAASEGT